MKRTNLNNNWIALVEHNECSIDFPFDALTLLNRSFSFERGLNSFYKTETVAFSRALPIMQKGENLKIIFEGLCGYCDVIINGVSAGIAKTSFAEVDITSLYKFNSVNNVELRITAPSLTGRYIGLGISGGIFLACQDSDLSIEDNGIFARTLEIADKAIVNVRVNVCNYADIKNEFLLSVALFNSKKKRVSLKVRKIKIKARCKKSIDFVVRMARHYDYNEFDPYMYSIVATITANGEVVSAEETAFGITTRAITRKGLVINGKVKKLKGCLYSLSSGVLGMVNTFETEKRKLDAIKSIGYNAVRILGCPSEATLKALDNCALFAVVDLFHCFEQGDFPFDSHETFKDNFKTVCEKEVRRLRNHPSVVMYCLGDDVAETYNRGTNYNEQLVKIIKSLDESRPITINAKERVPSLSEIEAAFGKAIEFDLNNFNEAAARFAKAKNMFASLTKDAFTGLDVVGLSDNCSSFSSYATPVIGLSERKENAFEALEEADKLSNVVGNFLGFGMDFLGSVTADGDHAIWNDFGDLDIVGNKKPISFYKEILLGNKNLAYIVARPQTDADKTLTPKTFNGSTCGKHNWNFSDYVGQNMVVEVFSGGDIVALYLDGKLIGRKLAGKTNKYMAAFVTPFYPGKLEAVSFHRGFEISRVSLETVSAPRAIKLKCSTKTLGIGKLCFVDISVTDKEGRAVAFAEKNVSVAVSGGKLVFLASADSKCAVRENKNDVALSCGKALCAVSGDSEGKITVKVTAEGMLSNKATIKVVDKNLVH